ncbi:UNVERIFIED_CONTAM: hypothetical protein HDU68_011916 [Siphonaria sp. JEL0065]|nr:hypothetical protein HDU68_011916 [Siphonaria sp. JEL0065]
MTTTSAPAVTRLVALTAKGLTTWKVSATSHLPLLSLAVDSSGDIVWSADARYFATSLTSHTAAVAIRDCSDGKVVEVVPSSILETVSAHRVSALSFGTRRNSRYLYLACGKQILVWDRKDRKVCLKFTGHTTEISGVCLNVDETSLASGGVNGEMKIHSLKTNTTSSLASPLTQSVNKCAFSPFKKSVIAAVGDDGSVVVWDFNLSAQPMFVVNSAHVAPIHGLAWSPCNKSLFATAGLDRKVLVYNKDENGKILLKFETDSPVTSLTVNDDFVIAAGSISGKVTLFDVRTRKTSYYFHTNTVGEAITALQFEPPQWAQETSQRDQGGMNSASNANKNPQQAIKQVARGGSAAATNGATKQNSIEQAASGSGSPIVAAFKERMAAVKEKQSGLMDLFSPVKPTFRQDSNLSAGAPSLGGSSNLREVVTAEDEPSENVQVTPVLLSRGKGDLGSNTLDLFSPLGGSQLAKTPSKTTSPQLKTPPVHESNPFFSKLVSTATTTAAPYGAPHMYQQNQQAQLPTSDPIARLQNALNQLKSKTPMKSTTPEDTNVRTSPTTTTTMGGSAQQLYYSKPMSPIMSTESQDVGSGSGNSSARLSLHGSKSSHLSGMETNNEKLTLKNLPGSPGHVAVAMPASVTSSSLFQKRVGSVSSVNVKEEYNLVQDLEDQEDEEDEEEDDTDIWLTKEILQDSDAISLGWASSAGGGGGLVGDEFSPPKNMVNADLDAMSFRSKFNAEDSARAKHEDDGAVLETGVSASGGYAHKVLEAVLESCLEDFRKQVKEEIQNMHIELLRQFYNQKSEISELFQANSPSEALLKEVVRLREENARLRNSAPVGGFFRKADTATSAVPITLPSFSIFKQAASRLGETAIVDGNSQQKITYNQLLQATTRVKLGPITQGARVAFLYPRRPSYVVAQWATWINGAVAIPLCTSHPPKELAHVVSDSQASTVLYAPEFSSVIDQVKPFVPNASKITWSQQDLSISESSTTTTTTQVDWTPLNKDQGALIIYTSGTTGKPKGVLSTFSNVESQVSSLHQAWKWTHNDRILLVLPLHHVHGVINVVTCALAAGAVLEMAPEKMSPKSMWERFMHSDRNLTLFMAVPTIYARLLEYFDSCGEQEQKRLSDSCKQFRLMVSGSAALPVTVFDKWEKVSGERLLERYGMTEIGMALGNPYDGVRESGKVGVPFPGVEAKIVDQETGEDITRGGRSGELFVKGPQVFKEYWNNPAATEKAFEDGWFATGDIATVIQPGNTFQILGRASVDIIKSGGFKLSALTIERELLSLPDIISDVAVLGVPDETWGERVGAIVVVKAGVVGSQQEMGKRLQGLLKDRLAKYEIPTVWRFVDQIPRNAMLKVNKKSLVSLFK